MFSDSVDRSRFDCQHTVDGPTDGPGGGENLCGFLIDLMSMDFDDSK